MYKCLALIAFLCIAGVIAYTQDDSTGYSDFVWDSKVGSVDARLERFETLDGTNYKVYGVHEEDIVNFISIKPLAVFLHFRRGKGLQEVVIATKKSLSDILEKMRSAYRDYDYEQLYSFSYWWHLEKFVVVLNYKHSDITKLHLLKPD